MAFSPFAVHSFLCCQGCGNLVKHAEVINTIFTFLRLLLLTHVRFEVSQVKRCSWIVHLPFKAYLLPMAAHL